MALRRRRRRQRAAKGCVKTGYNLLQTWQDPPPPPTEEAESIAMTGGESRVAALRVENKCITWWVC